MNKELVRIRYDGPALKDHMIDVNHLAPALLALGNICTLTNSKFNGDRASLRVMVRADIDAKCFDVGIELIQIIPELTRLFAAQDVKTAKEILEWLGIIGGYHYGLFALYKLLNGRKITKKIPTTQAGRDLVEIHVEGSNNTINVHPQTAELIGESKVSEFVKKILNPLEQKDYASLQFKYKNVVSVEITKDEASKIINTEIEENNEDETDETEEESQEFTAFLKIYSSIFDQEKHKWKFDIGGGDIQSVDISETRIVQDALERGGVGVGDVYEVILEKTQKTKNNQIKSHYKVKKLIKFTPGKRNNQGELSFDAS